MPFKKTGSPTKITEVLSFDVKSAVEVSCPKCGTYCGFKSGSLSKRPGKGPEIAIGKMPFKCSKCQEAFHV